jgi:polysaccharide export outer membrane protein
MIQTGMRDPRALRTLPCLVLLALLSLAMSMPAAAQSDAASQPAAPAANAPSQPGAGNQASGKAADAPPVAHSDSSYVIGANDMLAVSVWKEPDVSRTVPVRSDGKISLPLVGELQAGGQTPLQLEEEITKRLKNYISEPEVTVIVTDSKSQKVNILGMVSKPGAYLLTSSTTVLDAVAMAGGFKDFAKQKSMYVLRQGPDGKQERLPFNYKDVIKGKNPEQNIRLQAGDTVVIP